MTQPKRFDINKVENFLKNSADNAQTRSYWNAAVEHGKTVKVIDENLASNDDDKQSFCYDEQMPSTGENDSLRQSKMQ